MTMRGNQVERLRRQQPTPRSTFMMQETAHESDLYPDHEV